MEDKNLYENTKRVKLTVDKVSEEKEEILDESCSFEKELDRLTLEMEEEEELKDKKCVHNVIIKNLCVECGTEVIHTSKFVGVVHNSDQILQNAEDAYQTQVKHFYELFRKKKLILLCDLDQTLIHTTLAGGECDFVFEIDGLRFFVKKRPGLDEILEKLYKMFELHMYTMGTREYADEIVKQLDPERKYFGDRIITRTENNNALSKNIKRILSFDKNVLALDDRVDVWGFIGNVIAIKPFYFYDVDDLNDPCMLAKRKSQKNIVEGMLKKAEDDVKSSIENKIKEEFDDLQQKDLNFKVEDDIENDVCNVNANNKIEKDDNELLKVYETFKKIHTEFFEKNKDKMDQELFDVESIVDVKEIARLNVCKNMCFVCAEKYKPFVEFLGGRNIGLVDLEFDDKFDKKTVFTIEDERIAVKYDIINLSFKFLMDCIFQRKCCDVEVYAKKS